MYFRRKSHLAHAEHALNAFKRMLSILLMFLAHAQHLLNIYEAHDEHALNNFLIFTQPFEPFRFLASNSRRYS